MSLSMIISDHSQVRTHGTVVMPNVVLFWNPRPHLISQEVVKNFRLFVQNGRREEGEGHSKSTVAIIRPTDANGSMAKGGWTSGIR